MQKYYYYRIAFCLFKSKKYYELETETKNLIQKYPNIAALFNILGFALQKKGDLDSAIENFEKAISIDPNFIFAHNNLGNAYKDLGKFNEAFNKYEEAIKLKPDYAEAYYNQGCLHRDNFNYNESIERFEKAIKIKPDYFDAYINLGFVLRNIGKLDDAIKNYQKTISLNPGYLEAYNNILFTLFYSDKDDLKYNQSQLKKYRSALNLINPKLLTKYKYENNPKKLNVGFISGDFKEHPVGYFLLNTLKNLKKKELNLFAYSNSAQKDNLTSELKSHFGKWQQIEKLKDIDVINQIREDGIHILFDMSGHSAKNRLSIFVNKPAPIQASWAGYAGSTGLPEIDYLIGDAFVTPINENNHFIEKIFRLPNIWVCFSPPDFEVKLEKPPALSNGYITFGCFNNLSKINDKVISLWSKILKEIPKSKIFIKTKELNNTFLKEKLIDSFKKNNIDLNLIILEGGSPRNEFLSSYNKIDIALDPFPYSGGVTTFEALWMGVPVLTKQGTKFVSHTSESINYNSGMSDWIAKNEEEYFSKAIQFSSDLDSLYKIKINLRKKVLNSSSFNASIFATQFNNMLWKMWKNFNSDK